MCGVRYELLRIKGVHIGLGEGFQNPGLWKSSEGRFNKCIIIRRDALKECNAAVVPGYEFELAFI
jgi:hypothetical protein